jgi:hypothetical protein
MSAFMFITRSWPVRGSGRATAARPAPVADEALASPAITPSPAATASATPTASSAPTSAPGVGDPPVRSRPDDVDRPILRRTRRYRSDGVLGMRWLA